MVYFSLVSHESIDVQVSLLDDLANGPMTPHKADAIQQHLQETGEQCLAVDTEEQARLVALACACAYVSN